jgi:phosphate transport system substrate-binding protein
MKHLLLAILVLACMGLFAAGSITIDGSTTVGPIAKAFAEYYMNNHQGVNVQVSESGSGNGAKALINGACDIADMSRAMKPEELTAAKEKGVNPVQTEIAWDGIAVIVHPSNPVQNLTIEQIRSIYNGKVTNWKALGGPDKPIVIISRDTNSGTYECFEGMVMNKEKMFDQVEYDGSNGSIKQKVQSTPLAIGYVGHGFVDSTVKAVSVNSIKCTKANILSKKYPIARPLYMYTNGAPKAGGDLAGFLGLYKTKDGKAIIEKLGYVALQ